ncbi:DUF3570 domain-containing protein [Aurantivibrio plasticivorans]
MVAIKFNAIRLVVCTLIALCLSSFIQAAVLPEDRADILYHAYDGGGADINGPYVLVRKGVSESVSVYGHYYVDMVSSATIDVEVQGASRYEEERTEYSLGMDYLHNRSILSVGFTNSSENDYEADTYSIGISQDVFGDLTNISFGFVYGSNWIGRNTGGEEGVVEAGTNTARRYKLGVSQILTKDLIIAVNYETAIDEGFLNNPYRQVRALTTPFNPSSQILDEPEIYPNTRNSDALSLKARYFLPYRAALGAEYRTYSDSWDIQSQMLEIKYAHPLPNWGIKLEGKYRGYSQTAASFYSDLFQYQNIDLVEFRARDKEMSEMSSQTIGIGISYEFKPNWLSYFDKTTLNFYWDYIQFDYDNFRDARVSTPIAGEEPLYSFDANVYRLFWSFWY